ncbi:MAG: type IV pilus biogenesis protein EbsA [Prochlorococcus sp.]
MLLSTPPDVAQSALFAPYCGGLARQGELLSALRLLATGHLSGERPLSGGKAHRFKFSWRQGASPMEPSDCQLSFPDQPEISYSFAAPTHQLVDWLMDCSDDRQKGDLPDRFWSWLLLGEETPGG